MTAYRTWFKSLMALHMWMISQDRLLASKKALVNRLIWQKRLLFRPNYFYEYLPTVASLKAAISHCRGSHIKFFLDTWSSDVYSTSMRITLWFRLHSSFNGFSSGLRAEYTWRNNKMKARVESARCKYEPNTWEEITKWKLGSKVWDVSTSRIRGTYSQ